MLETGLINDTPSLILPNQLVAGDNIVLSVDAGNYGDSTYTATFTLAAGTTKLTAAGTLVQGRFTWNIPGTDTSTLIPGPYLYSVSVSNGTVRYTIRRGGVSVVGDISNTAIVASSSILRQQLDAVDKNILILLSQQATVVTYAGKSYQFQDVQKLYDIRNNLRQMVQDEQDEQSGDTRARKILVSFVNV